ncbi:MAG: hypothetical protein JWL90_3151 [Chthoniobacteraceae bacterium]|nr:hypothetical protein [Chthoniobacteraceae bacterium]
MTLSEMARYRLANQQMVTGRCSKPAEIVGFLGAMQAQDYTGALWSIGLRLKNGTEAGIKKAISERTIVRTWPMRGTLHFVAAADVHWMLKLLTPRIIAGSARRSRDLELDAAILARCRNLFVRALEGGRQLTRDEMYALLDGAKISTAQQRGYHILWRLAQERVICFGSHSAKQPTFTLLDEWVPEGRPREPEEALAELALRYFTSHGPATIHDFAWWSGQKISDARAGLESVSAQLASATIDGVVYWMPANLPPLREMLTTHHLLPGFDEYLISYKDRRASLHPLHGGKVNPGSNGVFMPTIVKNGWVTGTWKRVLKKERVIITASQFDHTDRSNAKELAGSAENYGTFIALPFELRMADNYAATALTDGQPI